MDVPLAVGIGLIASFVQSLGITIQRRSHIQNERLPESQRQPEWLRPLWVIGFVIFLGANISGTLFQIGTLPVVILAPLGAVSLLYNALLARVMLDAFFSWHMLTGTCLIAIGAVLIGYFGTVPHSPRTLDELIALYERPAFVALAVLYLLVFVSLLTMAHLTEWQLTWHPVQAFQRRAYRRRPRFGLRRYLPVPSLATVAEVSENSSGITSPLLQNTEDDRVDKLLSGDVRAIKHMRGTLPENPASSSSSSSAHSQYGAISHPGGARHVKDVPETTRESRPSLMTSRSAPTLPVSSAAAGTRSSLYDSPSLRPTVLALAVVYSSASGTLSGICLLMAKSGVDLLILSLQGRNQFGHWKSWLLAIVLLIAALLQLWYLHKSLKLADPVLIAPLAFCFYNISSITLGLVYFDDLSRLSWLSIFMVTTGTVLLLWGVWIISLHKQSSTEMTSDPTGAVQASSSHAGDRTSCSGHVEAPPPSFLVPSSKLYVHRRMHSSAAQLGIRTRSSSSISLDHAPPFGTEHAHESPSSHRTSWFAMLAERGLSVGLSPSSPGFHVQPHLPHHRMSTPSSALRHDIEEQHPH